ncbi:MAG TPA: hypothetical protein VFZ28_15125 [Burkholderiaceae bacterium]|nr:hypothetical protein [Burkholderiaceae bacterium]
MSKSRQSIRVLAVVIGLGALGACQTPSLNMPVAKIDNGLGDLPPYREWVDPTGRSPMGTVKTATGSTN